MQCCWSHPAEASLLIGCAVDEAGELCPADGSGTHHARFHGHIECAAREILATREVGGRRNGLHFGMGRHVVQHLREVMGARNDAFARRYHASHRNLACTGSGLGLLQSHAHQPDVGLLLIHDAKIQYSF